MSRYAENTVWESPDGTWNIGFHPQQAACGGECGDDTHEWCSDFDFDRFDWVSTGHPTPLAAEKSWDGANPGTHTRVPFDRNNPESVSRVEELEDMAAGFCESATARLHEARAKGARGVVWADGRTYTSGTLAYYGYHGPLKQRSLKSLGRERNQAERANLSYPLNGQARPFDDEVKAIQAKVDARLKVATDAEKRDYLDVQAERRDGLTEMLTEHRANAERRRRANAGSIGMYRGYNAVEAERTRTRMETVRAGVEAVENRIAGVDKTRAEQEREFFPPAPAKAAATKPAAQAGAQGRVAKGVPAGGQFAASAKGEADVTLRP